MKNILKKYFPIVAIIISFVLAAVIGGYFTSINMDWYFGLNLPSFTPPGSVIGMVWTGIYILVSMSALFYFLKVRKDKEVFALFIINAILNLSWTILFFHLHLELLSIVEMSFLNMTTIFLIYLMYRKNIISSILLIPYVLWVSFATYLTYMVMVLN